MYGFNSYRSNWFQQLGGLLSIPTRILDSVELQLSFGAAFSSDLNPPPASAGFYSNRRTLRFGIDEAYVQLPLVTMESGSVNLKVGIFRQSDTLNVGLFGEHLLRYGGYPGTVERKRPEWDVWERGGVPLLGVKLSKVRSDRRGRHDFFLLFDSSWTSQETDFSLAWLTERNATSAFRWTFGLQWFRFFSTNPDGITVKTWSNGYVKTDSGYVYLPWDTLYTARGDTGYYTRRSIQAMVRLNFEPRFNRGNGSEPGSHWRFFAEADLLGLLDQPIFYEDWTRRLATTFGLGWPSFGLLNELETQLEWHPTHLEIKGPYFPWPYLESPSLIPEKEDAWSFALFAKRTMFRVFSLQARYLDRPETFLIFNSASGESRIVAERFRDFAFRIQWNF